MPLAIAAAAILALRPACAQTEAGQDETPAPADAVATVTITNLTKGQILTPAVVFSHSPDTPPLFVPGEPASLELERLAELGITSGLSEKFRAEPSVLDVTRLNQFIRPGSTASAQIRFDASHRLVSLASMIEITNDGFIAVRGAKVPCDGPVSLLAGGWDAGSEANSERCPDVPARCPQPTPQGTCAVGPAEGFVHVHAGIHGCANFPAEVYDWRHPVARIDIAPDPAASTEEALQAACSDAPGESPEAAPGSETTPTPSPAP
ncbi:MAG: spondin domain-containing protein [Bryobacterales bacterium]|nr:spondin domain-containing protein [Bryobacterales bacterium]